MPKKSKAEKASAVTAEKEEIPKACYAEIIAQDPDFYLGASKFEFPNGDKYEGEYCAHASGLVWRQGKDIFLICKGTYTTKDGQMYVGEWDGDKLVESNEVQITFSDGAKYLGNLLKNEYSGTGIYQLEEKVSLTCNFVENKPEGEITLIDPNGKVWHGFAEKDECLLIQEHPFYRSIGKDLGKGRPRHKPIQSGDSKTSLKSSLKSETDSKASLKYRDLRDLEKETFAHSKKIPSDLQLESSDWYQDYLSYYNTYGSICRKAKNNGEGSLNTEEYVWYKKYREFEKKCEALLKEHKSQNKKSKIQVDSKLFRLIHSEQYKLMNKPMPVFYPRVESVEDCDSTCEC